ncbi:hypothetical protein CR203_22265 [Salipaludibacillus neizhouensis]|uniref:Tyr recombinase domain-containing protein n=1 Tax=Salipaludibacillus neizhouensis TaxID=885475 RepID=A0A3A9KJW4_9BACI|nr:hypothetical protein CR203_22265 [Salipaludibacillus neizhouensis]
MLGRKQIDLILGEEYLGEKIEVEDVGRWGSTEISVKVSDSENSTRALFVTKRNPHWLIIAQRRYIIKRISSRVGINKSIHPHQLRHSYATHLMNNGTPLEVIQNLLGHEKSETPRIYA